MLACSAMQAGTFTAGDKTFLLNGKPFVIKAAEVHYPRIPRPYWEHRIKMCKALGMNTLCIYIFWNLHEQQEGVYDFTGNLVVSNKITVTASNKTFKGGLHACEGSTLNVATSVFEGDVMIEAGVKFTDVPDPTEELSKPVTLLQTKGTITSVLLDYKDPLTKNRYYVRTRGEIKELCYGRKPCVIIVIE